MNITLALFASLRQKAGWAKRTIHIPNKTTVEGLLDWIEQEYPELKVRQIPLYVAVNEEYAEGSCELHEEDQVAFFPPVSGGAC